MPPAVVNGTISDLAPASWFKDKAQSSFWLRLATMVGQPPVTFIESLRALEGKLSMGAPFFVAFGTTKGFKVPRFEISMSAGEDGQTIMHTKISEDDLPEGHYWFIATPLRVDGVQGNEPNVRRLMARFSALVVSHCGVNTMHEVVFEGEIEAGDGKLHSYSNPIRTVQPADGPFMSAEVWKGIQDVTEALIATPLERRQRIELSLEFFDQAVRGEEEFFNYWTALEILANGKAQTIRSKIQKCYSLPSIGEVDKRTGFGCLARWRHDYFHKGKRTSFIGDEARYIQMLFLDLLRNELELTPVGYLAAIQNGRGYNLSGLGLPDNRTPEQLEAVRRALEQRKPSEQGQPAPPSAPAQSV